VKVPHRGEPAGLGVEVGHVVQAAPFQVWVKPDGIISKMILLINRLAWLQPLESTKRVHSHAQCLQPFATAKIL
jgi:hypothetical protein